MGATPPRAGQTERLQHPRAFHRAIFVPNSNYFRLFGDGGLTPQNLVC